MTGDLLSAVVAAARRRARLRAGEAVAERDAPEARRSRGASSPGERFVAALQGPGVRVIAECKRRSPSRGILRPNYDPVDIARDYLAGGAAAVSVLTEPTFFDGSLEHLRSVRAAVDLPILCKDFIVDAIQIEEAARAGADAVLLIAAALSPDELVRLQRLAWSRGLAALVEVHDHAELDRALDAGARIVGVNSRNLRTLEVDGAVFEALGHHIPTDVVAIAESGLRTGDDLRRLMDLRYDAFLIGERLMTDTSPGVSLAELLSAADRGGRR